MRTEAIESLDLIARALSMSRLTKGIFFATALQSKEAEKHWPIARSLLGLGQPL